MVDDRLKNLQDIETALQKYDPKITFIGMESMRMLKKGQVRNVGKNVVKQNSFVRSLFGIAA